MVKSFRHAGLEKFYRTGAKKGIQPNHAAKLARQLAALDDASKPGDLAIPGWSLHPLNPPFEGTLGDQSGSDVEGYFYLRRHGRRSR